MLAFHAWFVPLIGYVVFRLLRRQLYRDVILFLCVSVPGYGLWLGIVNHRPIIITEVIARIMDAILKVFGS